MDRRRGLKRRVEAVQRGAVLPRYPQEIRDALVEECRKATAAGESRASFAAEMGVAVGSLARWMAAVGEGEPSGDDSELCQVVVIDEPSRMTHGVASVVTPDGFRIEGVAIDALPRLLASLR